MNIFGWSLTRSKGTDMVTRVPTEMVSPLASTFGGIFGLIRESFAGAWQRNIEYNQPELFTQSTVWSCITLIMSDVGKIGVNVIRRSADGIWELSESSAFSPVLRKPNHYQDRNHFFEQWIASKLTRGNTYVLKAEDNRRVVHKLFILDPTRVQVLVAPDGSVFYDLQTDNLAGLDESNVRVPASSIIHDRHAPLYHPLCGLSPIAACGLPALQSLKIQHSSAKFFSNNSKPGGVLTAPKTISADTAARIKEHWEANYAGEDNIGRVAVLGDGLQYQAMAVTAHDAQLIDQLNWGDERICSTFHVPGFLVGVGQIPGDQNAERLIGQYYAQCLQALFEKIESALDIGLDLPSDIGVEFDIEGLIRMDSATKMKIATEGVQGGLFSPNEARRKYFNLGPVQGGESPYLQQQNWSLEDLARRRELGEAPKPITAETPLDQPDDGDATKALVDSFRDALEKLAA